MGSHFTYDTDDKKDRKNLQQGDLLNRSERLQKILKKYHPYYLKPGYKNFIVLTQSCDLFQRNEQPCSANYISLAPVKLLTTIIHGEVNDLQTEPFEKKADICRSSKKNKVENFLKTLLDNNQKEYFYLHEDDESGLSMPCLAFLRLSISIRSEHYKACLDSKLLQLNNEFRAKLGWLVGNLYSRVGTADWVPDYKSKKEFNTMISDILNRQFIWYRPEIVDAFTKKIRKEEIDIGSMSSDDIKKLIEDIEAPTKAEKSKAVLGSIESILKKTKALNHDADLEKILSLIELDSNFKSYIK